MRKKGITMNCYVEAYRALADVETVYNRALDPFGVTALEASVLELLTMHAAGLTMTEIAHAVGRPRTSIVPLLDRLLELELVESWRALPDRRLVQYALTDAGRERAAAILPALALAHTRAAAVLADAGARWAEPVGA